LPAPIKIAIAGALGRMGRALTAAVEADAGLELVARFDRPGAEGEGLVSMAQALAAAQVVIDFTVAEASAELAGQAAGKGVALVVGSTGLSPDHLRRIAEAATRVPVVRAGNFSLGVNLLMGMVAQAARALPADAYDIEVF
jgi:4-hydroxy-tetrahydrodipicolinate reductase